MNVSLRFGFLVAFVVIIYTTGIADGALDSQYSNLPPPPAKPDKFETREQLRQYLVKLHEYYAIIGRPRFGRSPVLEENMSLYESDLIGLNALTKTVFDNLDVSPKDSCVSMDELQAALRNL